MYKRQVTVVVAVFGALAIYQTLLRKQNREITNKNNLFDLLSKTIDHVFFVHNPSNSKENYVSENAERLIGFPAEILSLNPAPFYSCIDSESREILRKIFTDRKLDFWEGTDVYKRQDLEDPIGRVDHMTKRPNGLLIGKKRTPFGVIAIIYEARPNVTSDAAALCFKTSNAVILRGGK